MVADALFPERTSQPASSLLPGSALQHVEHLSAGLNQLQRLRPSSERDVYVHLQMVVMLLKDQEKSV